MASTITLLERYSMLALLGIATADMKEHQHSRPVDPAAIDPQRNLAAAAWLTKAGLDPADYEAEAGRKRAEWTAADVDGVKAWAAGQEREPGEEG